MWCVFSITEWLWVCVYNVHAFVGSTKGHSVTKPSTAICSKNKWTEKFGWLDSLTVTNKWHANRSVVGRLNCNFEWAIAKCENCFHPRTFSGVFPIESTYESLDPIRSNREGGENRREKKCTESKVIETFARGYFLLQHIRKCIRLIFLFWKWIWLFIYIFLSFSVCDKLETYNN